MAMQGPIPVEFGTGVPRRRVRGRADRRRCGTSSGPADRVVQQADKDSGLPLWVVEVIDAQEDARQRTVKVKIAAQVQPVLPSPAPGSPFTAVEFDGMTVTPTWTPPAARARGHGAAPGWRTRSRPPASAPRRAGSPGRRLSTRTRRDRPARPGGAPVPAGRLPVRGGVRAVPGQGPDVRHRHRRPRWSPSPCRSSSRPGTSTSPASSRPRRGRTRSRSNAATGACRRCRTSRSRTR